VYNTLGKIILGDEVEIEKHAEKSWPIFAMNILTFGKKRSDDDAYYTINSFIDKSHTGLATRSET
jgi:hypothetical protein